ncbi:glutamate--cysteine ligase [Glaciecola petra]|uniref:Glutamate--cysteine ligase n=1 Tax=Glaciecola petra TaxID=3075602 RepID=A0ABU2ZMP3_9ALTE|nr:glutamate--cysteine ligase [Aestuariibacter sp. P117]MDT0593898.1 glutamate--cysteine ligase [Aestuariibacter sp. P117]
MTEKQHTFEQRLAAISASSFCAPLKDIKHGVERETLRVNNDGGIATSEHPVALGSALTNDWITTDFSESLLEFITPPDSDINKTISQLIDIHKFTYESIGNELLWPMSMPCFIDSETNIPIAKYGQSNVAKMKEVYRQGLHHRYGSMMQVISGVHFNFSLPESFWQKWCELHAESWNKHTQSAHYYAMVRNFRRLAWVIPYLFGASPALCGSFISHRNIAHQFKKVGKGTLYMPYATSLRMSDLGYTSSAQSNLSICYNNLDTYVATLRSAIGQHAPEYAHLGHSEKDGWQQLNANVLQIENELYSPIRPKQVAKSLEMPTNALEDRGVSYLEVRSLDVNPYSPIGIDSEQFYFLDVFLLHCLLTPSAQFQGDDYSVTQNNMDKSVKEGRNPELMLNKEGLAIKLSDWGCELIEEFSQIADLLDKTNNTKNYSKAVQKQKDKFINPELTPSGLWLKTLLDNDIDNSSLGLELAKQYKQHNLGLQYKNMTREDFEEQAKLSFDAQMSIEKADTLLFSDFIASYFGNRKSGA